MAAVEIQLPDHARDRLVWLQTRGFAPMAPTSNRILLRRPTDIA